MEVGVVFWRDALYSDFKKFPGLPDRVNASFGIIDTTNKEFIRVGANCDLDYLGKLVKMVDGIMIPRKTIIRIVYLDDLKKIYKNK